MSTTILSSLAAYIRRILRLRPMAGATLHAFLDAPEPNVPMLPTEVEVFQARYVKRASVTYQPVFPGEPDGALLRSARISSISLMKAHESPEHEYILAYVETIDSTNHRFRLGILRCERTVQSNTDAKMHAKAAVGDIQHISSPSLDPISAAASDVIPAIDQFVVYSPSTTAKTLSGGDSTVYHYTFPLEKQPPLEHLIAVACALHEVAKAYSIFRRQCFWFAGMVYRILVGPDADDAPAVDSEAVNTIIRHAEAETRAGAETQADGGANVQPRPVVPANESARKAGTFKYIFNIVTLTDIEKSYKKVEPKFTERTQSIRARVMGTDVSQVETLAHRICDMSDSDCDQLFALVAARRGLGSMAAAGPSRAD